MFLKNTSALFALASLLQGAIASPVEVISRPKHGLHPTGDPDTWHVWSDSSRCGGQENIKVVIKDSVNNKIIQGEKQSTGELLFRLKSPFVGSYVLTQEGSQLFDPPEVQIELFEKGKKPAGRFRYIPGYPALEFDRITWNPDPKIKNQKAVRPSLDNENFSFTPPKNGHFHLKVNPKVGKEESVDTNTYADTLWILWCTGELDQPPPPNHD